MKHIVGYKIFESKQFSSRDISNKYHVENNWVDYPNRNVYLEIKKIFGISCDKLGEILQEFVEEYNLLYSCLIGFTIINSKVNVKDHIEVRFYPNSENYKNTRNYIEDKVGHDKRLENGLWNWDILSEMNDRLSEYGLTIKNNDGSYKLQGVNSLYLRITR